MKPTEFLRHVREAYLAASVPTIRSEGVYRHRVRSTSGVQEDLVAYFIRSQADNLEVHIDQPITIRSPADASTLLDPSSKKQAAPKKTWYPDIVVVRRHAAERDDGTYGAIIALVDVKTDLGWNRTESAFAEVCQSLNCIRSGLLEGLHKPLTSPLRRPRKPTGAQKPGYIPKFDPARLDCAEDMTCHLVVVTAANSGDISDEGGKRQAIAKSLNVQLHVLMELHPNRSKRQLSTDADTPERPETTAADLVRGSLRLNDFESLVAEMVRPSSQYPTL